MSVQILSKTATALVQRETQKLLDGLEGTTAVVVATADGFDLASATKGLANPSRLAAMACSIAAIGGVVSQEARIGRSTSVMIVTQEGFAVFHSVQRRDVELVIGVLACDSAVLAQVAYQTAQLAKTLADT